MNHRTLHLLPLLLVGLLAASAEAFQYKYREAMNLTGFWNFSGSNPLQSKSSGLTLANSGVTFASPIGGPNGWSPTEFSPSHPVNVDNRVAQFAGGQYLQLPNSAYSGGSFTFVVAQRRTVNDSSFRTLLASSRFRFQNVANTLQGQINSPGGSFGNPNPPLSINDWHFIALTYDDLTRGLTSYSATNTSMLGGPVKIGGMANAPGLGNAINFRIGFDGVSLIGGVDGFLGQLDFIGWHDGLLTQAQLQNLLLDFAEGPAAVPEPSTMALVGLGLVGLASHARRRRRVRH